MQYRRKVTTVYLLGFFVDLVNMFIATVAYPDIARAFGATMAELSWVSNAYILGLTIVIPFSAWLASTYGSKRILLLSLILFLIATVGSGNANSITELIGWRCVQGLGGGLLIPVGQTLAYQLYRANERASLSSLIMLVGLLAPALSPALGGWIVDALSWRWIFFLNIPFAVLTLLLAYWWLQPDRLLAVRTPLDVLGLALGTLSIVLILFGLTMVGRLDSMMLGLSLLLAGLLSMAWYIRDSLNKPNPILNLRLLQNPLLKISMLMYLFIPGVFMGVSLIAVLYLETVLGMSASQTGMLMLPWALAAFVAIILNAKIFNRSGPRPLFFIGALLHGSGVLALLWVGHASQMTTLIAAYMLMGFGASLVSSAAQSTAFLQIPDHHLSQASALWNINRQIGFCLGVALLGVLLNLLLAQNGVYELNDVNLNQHMVPIFHCCFAIAAASTVIPIIFCMRIKNAAISAKLT